MGTVCLLTPARLGELFGERPRVCHKGNFGTVGLLGGCIRYSGAAKLASLSLSALRAGCGVARLAVPDSLTQAVLPYLLESTLYPMPTDGAGALAYDRKASDGFLSGLRALGVGMGWDENPAHLAYLKDFLSRQDLTCVVDAGGLNALAGAPEVLAESRAHVVVTPHPGEFSRLTGLSVTEILADPRAAAETYAQTWHCIVLLKGATTVVTDGESTYLVERGCAGMASAGSGDVLSGILAGMMGYLPPTPETVAAGATLAGVAGEIAQEKNTDIAMVASDTVAALPEAIRKLRRAEK